MATRLFVECAAGGSRVIPIRILLTASHIIPWAESPENRMNPANGLCLANTQDVAFDKHLITLDEDLRLVLSRRIRDHFTSEAVRSNFIAYEGKPITAPGRWSPDPTLLARHRARFAEDN